jgi:hypothetical protein
LNKYMNILMFMSPLDVSSLDVLCNQLFLCSMEYFSHATPIF